MSAKLEGTELGLVKLTGENYRFEHAKREFSMRPAYHLGLQISEIKVIPFRYGIHLRKSASANSEDGTLLLNAARRHHKRKVWLTSTQVDMMLERARSANKRDYLLLQLMRYGLRCGEIVGWRGLPGIRTGDIRDQGIWIKGKGYARGIVQDRLVPMPRDLVRQLKSYAADLARYRSGKSNLEKIFPISEVWAERIVKKYARDSGVDDWERVGPHRLRAFFATDAKDKGLDAFTIRDLMRHKNITTTNLYVGQSSTDRLARLVEELAGP